MNVEEEEIFLKRMKNIKMRNFLCISLQENGRSVPDLTASPGRAPPGPMPCNQGPIMSQQRQGVKEPVLLQGDFRKVSGISSEIFRQIEAVENDHDPSTAAALEVSFEESLPATPQLPR
ncbi:rho GTPase-activating protein 100F-like isoform X1 [Sergentomyia squamirostris]